MTEKQKSELKADALQYIEDTVSDIGVTIDEVVAELKRQCGRE